MQPGRMWLPEWAHGLPTSAGTMPVHTQIHTHPSALPLADNVQAEMDAPASLVGGGREGEVECV